MPQIYELLHEDHEKVKANLNKILDTTDGAEKTREKLFAEVKHDLELHTTFEEKEFYPKFRSGKADTEAKKEVEDALEEHSEAKQMLDKMSAMDKTSEEFIEHVKKLKQALEHHISDEEDEMFPQARQELTDSAAEEMGKHYQQMK